MSLGLDHHDGTVRMSWLGGRERGDAACTHTGHPIHNLLEVLREVVAASDDDRLLPAAADVKLASGEIPEVACRAPAVADDLGGCPGRAQVALHHRRPRHEDLADDALADRVATVVDHTERVLGERVAAADETQGARSLG